MGHRERSQLDISPALTFHTLRQRNNVVLIYFIIKCTVYQNVALFQRSCIALLIYSCKQMSVWDEILLRLEVFQLSNYRRLSKVPTYGHDSQKVGELSNNYCIPVNAGICNLCTMLSGLYKSAP